MVQTTLTWHRSDSFSLGSSGLVLHHSFSASALLTFGAQWFLVVGAVLDTVEPSEHPCAQPTRCNYGLVTVLTVNSHGSVRTRRGILSLVVSGRHGRYRVTLELGLNGDGGSVGQRLGRLCSWQGKEQDGNQTSHPGDFKQSMWQGPYGEEGMGYKRKGEPSPRERAVFQEKEMFIRTVRVAGDPKTIIFPSPSPFHATLFPSISPSLGSDLLDLLGHCQIVSPQVMDHQRLMIPESGGCWFPQGSRKSSSENVS